MGLAISVVELPLLTIYVTTLALLQFFRPRKNFSGECHKPEEAARVPLEEWEEDSVKPGTTHIIEGSASNGKSIYIEAVIHESYVTATLVLSDEKKSIGGQFTGVFIDERTIQCGPLFLEMREPFRRWRVSFKGYLSNENSRHFVTIGGWWKPTSDARYYYSDIESSNFKFSKNFELRSNLSRLASAHFSDDLSQFGQLHLEVNIDGNGETLRFRGVREHFKSDRMQASDEIHAYLEDGNRISFKSVSSDGHSLIVDHGYMIRGDHSETAISLKNVDSLEESNHKLIEFVPAGYSIFFGIFEYPLRKGEFLNSFSYTSSSGHIVEIKHVKVNHALTNGIALTRHVKETLHEVEAPVFNGLKDVIATSCEKTRPVVPFGLRSCQDKQFTGGKGANLARLKSIENKYIVPNGAVVTTTAFDTFLQNHASVRKLVKELSTPGLSIEEYVSIGEKVVAELKSQNAPEYLISDLKEAGISTQEGVKFAVRSSAVGEDGSDLSSAGQLESVLNVAFNDIPEKILECWCSNFRKEVITYRRTYGQILNPSMAVVVQEMISNGVAGVMFTCDPVKNDDGKMVINAIFGCGEDIVSGAVTPDEIIVEKGDQLTIHKPEKCCVDEETIIKLANVGLFLEEMFGAAQDVEFVLRDGRVFIVQSRDVTGKDRESRFELLTELDTATLTDHEVFSTANVGEVCPFPQTQFEGSTFGDMYDKTMTDAVIKDIDGTHLPRHFLATFGMFNQRVIFNMGEMLLRQWELIEKDRLAEIAIGGSLIFTKKMFEEAKLRYKPLPKNYTFRRLYAAIDLIYWKSYKILKEIGANLKECEDLTPQGDATLESLLDVYDKQRFLFRKILSNHSDASMFSSFTYVVVGILIRGSEEGELTPEMLSDLANIFANSTSNVLSADVPASLKKLARAIRDDGLKEKFSAADNEEALAILRKEGKESAKQIEEFLKTHGHRGPKELYLRSDGWREKPEQLILTLKTMLTSDLEEKSGPSKSMDEVVDSLKCKPTGFRRWMMKYMVGQSHRGVACREFAKSHLVKSCYELRATAKVIAKHFFNKGLIPDEDLLFFMTIDECKRLYYSRNPRFIARAMRRRQIFGDLEKMEFSHVYHGNPEPINREETTYPSDVVLRGTVVCEGRVVARARVAVTLEEAKLTQPEEILITRSTDICWSPFFPIIKGIITEIGGLLSHGAVVAREYGLPSIIAVENATMVFKTGDLVELDSYKGTISKVVESSE